MQMRKENCQASLTSEAKRNAVQTSLADVRKHIIKSKLHDFKNKSNNAFTCQYLD